MLVVSRGDLRLRVAPPGPEVPRRVGLLRPAPLESCRSSRPHDAGPISTAP